MSNQNSSTKKVKLQEGALIPGIQAISPEQNQPAPDPQKGALIPRIQPISSEPAQAPEPQPTPSVAPSPQSPPSNDSSPPPKPSDK